MPLPLDTADNPSGSLPLRLPQWGGVFGLILLLWPWFWAWEYTYHPSALRDAVIPLAMAIALLCLVFSPRGKALAQRWQSLSLPGRKIIMLLLLFFLWHALSWYFAAEPATARMGLNRCLRLTLITAVAALLASNPKIFRGLLRSLVLSAALVGLAGIIVYFLGWRRAYYAPGRMEFPFSMPAVLGGVSMIGALGALAILYRLLIRKDHLPVEPLNSSPGKLQVAGVILALVLCLAGLILSGTLSSSVGLLAGVWLLGFLHLKKRRSLYLAATAAILLVSGYALLSFLQTPAGRAWMFNASWGIRPLYLKEALRLFYQRPFLGWGPDCFAYGVQINESMETFLHGARGGWVGAAHCEPAQVLSQLGLPGLLLWLVIYAGAFALCWKSRNKPGGLILLLILAGIFGDGLFSPAYHNAHDYNSLAALILGLAIARGRNNKACRSATGPTFAESKPALSRILWFFLLRAVLAAAAVIVILTSFQALYSQWSLANCVQTLNRAASLKETGRSLRGAGQGSAGIERRIRQTYLKAEALALTAMNNAWDIDVWQRAAGFHIKAINDQRNPARLKERIKLNWDILARLPALANVLHRIIGLEQVRGRPGEEFLALMHALRYQPYSYAFRSRLRSFLGKLDEPLFLALRNWREHKEMRSYLGKKLSWLSDADWQYLHAALLYRHGRKEKALELMPGINPAGVRVVPFNSEYGAMLVDAGRLREARKILEPACENIPADPVALVSLASALLREAAGENMGITAPAIPGNPRDLLPFLAAALSSEGGVKKCNRAYRLLFRALQRRRRLPEAALLFSQLSLVNGQPAAAVKALREALNGYSGNARLHAALIRTFLHCGSDQEALAALANAKQKCPNAPLIEELTAEIK